MLGCKSMYVYKSIIYFLLTVRCPMLCCYVLSDLDMQILHLVSFGLSSAGSYCTWPGVHCDECHVTKLRLEQPQDTGAFGSNGLVDVGSFEHI